MCWNGQRANNNRVPTLRGGVARRLTPLVSQTVDHADTYLTMYYTNLNVMGPIDAAAMNCGLLLVTKHFRGLSPISKCCENTSEFTDTATEVRLSERYFI